MIRRRGLVGSEDPAHGDDERLAVRMPDMLAESDTAVAPPQSPETPGWRRPAGARRRDPIVQGAGLPPSSWLEMRSDSIGHEVIGWRKEAETRLQRCGAGCDEEG